MRKNELGILIIIHLKELIRTPGVIFWGIGFPILMAWGLGITFNKKTNVRYDVAIIQPVGESKLMHFLNKNADTYWAPDSTQTYNIVIKDSVYGKTTFRFITVTLNQAIEGIKQGHFQLFIESYGDTIVYHLDPVNSDAFLMKLQLNQLINGNNYDPAIQAIVMPMKLQGTRYVDFLVPGLLSLSVMMACMWGISYPIIERRKGNLLRRMVATPMYKLNLLISLMTARFLLTLTESLLLLVFVYLYFNIHIQGSLMALLLIFITANIAFTGIAILFSSRTSNTEVGNAIINLITMPMMILSGIFFSYKNFPEWTIPIIKKLPLTIAADSFRSIINEGIGISQVWENALILSTIGVITLVAGMKIFKWY
jgi:ABC-type multidrug transport system permease subunit